jgi:tetratricopeptide (TPR) repeat protein
MREGLKLLTALLLLGAAHWTGERSGAARAAPGNPDQLAYLPEGEVLKAASLGHRNLMADAVWILAIQYYGEQRLTTRNYDQADRLFRLIYTLDPTFKGATRFGALVLAQDAGEPEAALALLTRAERDDPGAWEYPFDRGFILQTVLRDYTGAAQAYRHSSELPGAPAVTRRLAGLTFARLGDRSSSREVWRAIYDEAENDVMRSVAERNLKNLDMEDAEELLTAGVERFRAEHDRLPHDWAELLDKGCVSHLPPEPYGGLFLFDPGGMRVWATTHLDRRMAQERDVFQQHVRLAHRTDGVLPPSLESLVERGIMPFPPLRPMGIALDYDPLTGSVAWNPPWPATEKRNQGRSPV